MALQVIRPGPSSGVRSTTTLDGPDKLDNASGSVKAGPKRPSWDPWDVWRETSNGDIFLDYGGFYNTIYIYIS
jgi:hypothetical protein